MKFYTPEISWHERDPIYTCDFHPTISNKVATAGVSGEIRVIKINSKVNFFKNLFYSFGKYLKKILTQ